MHSTKRKVSVSLDATLVAELEDGDESLSAQVNAAVRAELQRRRRQRLLSELLDRLDAEQGPVPEGLVEKYVSLLA
jgi:antitoxin CcdA